MNQTKLLNATQMCFFNFSYFHEYAYESKITYINIHFPITLHKCYQRMCTDVAWQYQNIRWVWKLEDCCNEPRLWNGLRSELNAKITSSWHHYDATTWNREHKWGDRVDIMVQKMRSQLTRCKNPSSIIRLSQIQTCVFSVQGISCSVSYSLSKKMDFSISIHLWKMSDVWESPQVSVLQKGWYLVIIQS